MPIAHVPSRLSTLLLLGLLPVATGGCGFLLTQGPPTGHEQMTSFSCTEGTAGPVLDIVWGGLNVLGAIAVASDPDSYENPGQIQAVGIGWGVISGLSAANGFSKASRCRAALRQLSARLGQGPRPQPAGGFVPALPSADLVVQAVVVKPAADTLGPGERVQLAATAHNSSGAVVPNRAFIWSSSNDAIASVSGSGLVTANAVGSVVIASRTENYVGTASILVVARP